MSRYVINKHQPSLPPPNNPKNIIRWLHRNLFSSWLNIILTLVSLYLIYSIFTPLISWAFINANWFGSADKVSEWTREDCTSWGACWVFIAVRFQQFIYGLYPTDQTWRLDITMFLFAIIMAWLLIPQIPYKKVAIFLGLIALPLTSFYLINGGSLGLESIDNTLLGGLSLTLVIAVVGIVISFPLGVLLALGRRSQMPIVSSLCTAFIEICRGVPLITVLFMASVMLPLFLPEEVQLDKLLRALAGISLFQSAYMAEIVRSGLQSIPKGQYEAADSLGLGYWRKMGLVILPQALKVVIPGIMNTSIALFKETSLVAIIGLFDLLAMVKATSESPKWLGFSIEGYVFVASIFWVFCFGMSRYSIWLEKKLHTGNN